MGRRNQTAAGVRHFVDQQINNRHWGNIETECFVNFSATVFTVGHHRRRSTSLPRWCLVLDPLMVQGLLRSVTIFGIHLQQMTLHQKSSQKKNFRTLINTCTLWNTSVSGLFLFCFCSGLSIFCLTFDGFFLPGIPDGSKSWHPQRHSSNPPDWSWNFPNAPEKIMGKKTRVTPTQPSLMSLLKPKWQKNVWPWTKAPLQTKWHEKCLQ